MRQEVFEYARSSSDGHSPAVSARQGASVRRLMVGAMPAAAVTFALFTFMYVSIGGYEKPIDAEPLPELTRITPDIFDPVSPRSSREPVKMMEVSAPPPPMQKYSPSPITPFIPGAADLGRAPERPGRGDLIDISMIVVETDRTIQPIHPPNVVYPARLLERGIEGSCDVRFDVNLRGEAMNIRPQCSHPGLESSARRAVAGSRFSPKIVAGKPVEQRNVVYPIAYSISE